MFLKMILWLTVAGGGSTDSGDPFAFSDVPIEHNMKMPLLVFLVPRVRAQIYALEIHSSSKSTGIPPYCLPVLPGHS